MKHGDFTHLAEKYNATRPDYSTTVLDAIFGLLMKPASEVDAVDVGAGTGIWTRMLNSKGPNSIYGVEPNDAMREQAESHNIESIKWICGDGENTTLDSNSVDLVTMASSFHWVDFEKGTSEFNRILKDNGLFVALWNPRFIDNSPLLVEIENYLNELRPDMKRVSSGASGITNTLFQQLENSPFFKEVIYLEGRHTKTFTKEEYIGVWESVNDIRVQLGESKFSQFINFIKDKLSSIEVIEAQYKTRAWVARKG